MSIATGNRIRNEMCTIRICVDDHSHGEISGRLFNSYYKNPLFFENWIQVIKHMEAIFAEFGYPHETMTRRTFEEKTEQSDNDIRSEDRETDDARGSMPKGSIEYFDRRRGFENSLTRLTKYTLYSHNTLGRLGTFDTKVMFRQNASWQGMVRWVEGNSTENFKSTLELMFMIENSFDA